MTTKSFRQALHRPRPWKVVDHRISDAGQVVERVSSYSTLYRAYRAFQVAVLFDIRARLEFRGTAEECDIS